jgi:hypothetical protein
MLAGARGNAAGTPVALEDIAEALRLQVSDEQVVDRNRATRVRWIDRPRAATTASWGEARVQRLTSLAAALDRLRATPRPGRSGIGAVLVVHGPDTALAAECGEALASALLLPVARIGDGQASGSPGSDPDVDLPSPPTDLFAAMGGWGGPRSGGRGSRRQMRGERPEGVRWSEQDVAALMHDLGGCCVVQIQVPDADAVESVMPLVDALAVGPHVAVVHLADGAVSPELRRRAAAVLPWAVVDPGIRRLRWNALGGTGDPPPATAVAELTAAATRQALVVAGFVGETLIGVLP